MQKKDITVVGAGLVGSLLSIFLARRDHRVRVYERRPDLRNADIGGGRSINLALSDRGWKALSTVGVADTIRKMAIPMEGRMIHNMDGSTVFQPYGKKGQAIYSVSRGGLNAELMNAAERTGNVEIAFHHKCSYINLNRNEVVFKPKDKDKIEVKTDLTFGTDGAYSSVRGVLQKRDRFDYEQMYLKHGYKELAIPPDEDGEWQLYRNALHIWPRNSFMLIALPNLDGSFTCTLFLPFEGETSFEQLTTEYEILKFFNQQFADVVDCMPTLVEDFFANPTSSLVTIKCYPWTYKDRIAILGDASHAIVPFYGQGMNSGFEDCTILNELLDIHGENWPAVFHEFETSRKPDADAIAELALRNFIEMRDLVADPKFLLRKKIEQKLQLEFPDEFKSAYSLVTFSHIPYSKALQVSYEHDRAFEKILQTDVDEARLNDRAFLSDLLSIFKEPAKAY